MKRKQSWECMSVEKQLMPIPNKEMSQRLALVTEVLLEKKCQLRERLKSPPLESNYQVLRGQFRLPMNRRKTGTDD